MPPHTFAQRLFSLSGLVPLVAFAVIHVAEQSARVFWNASSSVVGPWPIATLVLLWAPLAFHTLYGVWLCFTPIRAAAQKEQVDAQPRSRAVLTRVSGIVALVFIVPHATDFRGGRVWQPLAGAAAMDEVYATLSSTRYGMPLTAAGYVLGLLAVAVHLGYGCHAALVDWGWIQTQSARKNARRALAFAALAWFVLGLTAVVKAATGTILPF